jgi:putative spermidine/putrescine transport system ATP-binding protein
MDEPLSALDKKLREEMQIELRHLHDSLNMTTVYVTHDQKEALTMSDRIAVINDGSLMQLGTPSEIYNSPNNAFIADFIGESSLIPIKVKGKKAYLGKVEILVKHAVGKDSDYLLVVRPEKLFISTRKEKDTNLFSGIVTESIFQGESQLLLLQLDPDEYGDQSLQMRIANGSDLSGKIPTVGDKLSIGLRKLDSFLVE